ncbi:PaaI family thioesterase [Phenylobacterium sp.]|uniref:PaaI family thioesterase n=1 Tax=Phenylobacterium sp. TaxID=1871053 RepID=UPI0025F3301A|nr:PaaI family thioesterase [Phenylobacterium sp.]MCA3715976.1 PaaI family thioesterase [Phenylobacterium sp.]
MGDGDAGYPTFTHVTLTEGPWAGWTVYEGEPFEDHAGPFHYRMDESGAPVCAMRTEAKHMNGGGFMHGGALMTFADYAIFIFAREHLTDSSSVTATLNADFVGAVPPGALLECRGEVVKGGRSLVFLRGLMTVEGQTVFSFSAVIKKTGKRG